MKKKALDWVRGGGGLILVFSVVDESVFGS